jgi:hypothetical protein
MITTGQDAWCVTWLLTEPMRSLVNPAAAAGPQDEHVGVMRGPDALFGRVPRGHGHGDLGCRLADFACDFVHEFLYCHPRQRRVKAVLPVGWSRAADAMPVTPERRLSERPS